MSLKLIQGFYAEECRRGKTGLGNYTLKEKYQRFRLHTENFEPRTLVCHPKDIVNAIRNRDFIAHVNENSQGNEYASNSRIIRAKELVSQDCISFSSRLGTFTVMDSNGIHVVKLQPNEICSCSIKKCCIHIMAVKLGLRIDLTANDLLPQNLAVIRKGVRGPSRQKPGRKRPRPGDVSNEKPGDGKYKKTETEQDLEQVEPVDEQYMERDLEQVELVDNRNTEQDLERELEQVDEQYMEEPEEQNMEHTEHNAERCLEQVLKGI